MELFLIWVVSMFLGAAIGGRKNAAGTGFLLGLLLGPLGVLIALVIQGDRKACPFCKELIHAQAVKCPRCQSDLSAIARPAAMANNVAASPGRPVTQADKQRMYRNLAIVVTAIFVLIVLGPHIQRALQ